MIDDGLAKKPPRKPTRDQLDMLAGKPELGHGAMRILHAYDDLSTCRPVGGMVMGAIPITAVYAWAGHHGVSYELTNHLWRVIRLIDAAIRARQAKGNR